MPCELLCGYFGDLEHLYNLIHVVIVKSRLEPRLMERPLLHGVCAPQGSVSSSLVISCFLAKRCFIFSAVLHYFVGITVCS